MMIVGCHLFAIVCPVFDGLHYLKHLGGDVCVCSAKSSCISGGRTSPPKPGSRGVYHVYHHVMQRTCDPLVLGMHRRTCLESEDL